MPVGIILKGVGGLYSVLEKEEKSIYTCTVRGIHRKAGGLTPLVGDRVTFDILDSVSKEGHIDQILERKNLFVRPPVANIDRLAIVIAIKSPQPDIMLVDKLIITCMVKGIEPIILINKLDLDDEGRKEYLKNIYKNTGFGILSLSKLTNEGYDELFKELSGKVTAFAGQSGVGKSTILNAVLNNWVMETGEVSDRIQRGKHTTRHVQLFRLNGGGFIMDTPGFSSFSIDDVTHKTLAEYYPEFETPHLSKFRGCSHTNEPQCAIKNLLNSGIIDKGRYDRYKQIYKELKESYDNRYRR